MTAVADNAPVARSRGCIAAANHVDQFGDAIRAAGLTPPDAIDDDGELHRFASNGKRGDDGGWYVLHGDGIPAGSFGDWRTGLSQTWRASTGRKLSPAEAAALRDRADADKRKREAERERCQVEARGRAARIWRAAQPADVGHPYLVAKGIRPHGIRKQGDEIVIPMRDGGGELHSLQYVSPTGDKKFLAGGRVAGCYFALGEPSGVLCIVEGYATAASVHEATGHAVAVAFNAGNLESVAVALRAKLQNVRIVICADDDYHTAGNPGMTAAANAARAVGGLLAVPDFGDNRPEGATDFNDLAQQLGADAVERAIRNARTPDVPTPQPSAQNATAGDLKDSDWPEPGPIRAALHSVPRFDADALLPPVLRDWVMDEAERMPCAPDFVASAVIVALGATIGARCAIKPKARDSWLVVANVWGGVVALPSAKKSPSISAGMAPLDRLAAMAQAAHRTAIDAFETDRLISDAKLEAIKDAIKSEAKKGGDVEGKANELRRHKAEAAQAPTQRRYRTNDSTVEKLGELLRDNPAGLLVQRDELVGLLASWEREGREGDRAFFLEAWNGTGSFDTDRIGRGSIQIPNLCLSVFGGIQPDKLTQFLEEAAHALGNDGTLQRFQVLVYPDTRPWEWRDRAPNGQARDAAIRLFETLADFDPVQWGAIPAAEGHDRFPHFRFDDGAQEVFIEWMHELQRERIPREQADGHPLIAQHLAKYDKLFPAIALILHLVECAATGRHGPVTAEAAIRAAAWCEYLEAHARRCYGLLADEGLRAAQALAERIQRGALADRFTAREVRRNRWRHLTGDVEVRAALDWLEDEHWLRAVELGGTGPGSGRRTLRYVVNPKVVVKARGQGAVIAAKRIPTSALAAPHPNTSENLQEAVHG